MSDPQGKDVLAARKAAAEVRVKAALNLIERAQLLVGRACAALSSVEGMNPEWRQLGKRYDEVHGAWYRVQQKAASLRARQRLLLAHVPNHHEAEWEALS